MLTGCHSPPPALKESRSWPPPPLDARIVYAGEARNPTELGARVSIWNRTVNLVTGSHRGRETWVRPFGISVDDTGGVCMTDAGAASVGFFDPRTKKFRRWSQAGKVAFRIPVSVAKRGDVIYVADTGLGAVLAFDLKGRLKFEIHAPIERPSAVMIYRDKLLVADSKAHALHSFDLEGNFLQTIGQRGEEPGAFNFPTHLTTNPQTGMIYVTDAMNFRVQKFDAELRYISSFGKQGQEGGQFSRPKGLAVDTQGHIYVADALFDNVQIFDDEGRFLMHWGEAGQDAGSFWMPGGIAIDQGNKIYVADSYNQRIQLFQYKDLP